MTDHNPFDQQKEVDAEARRGQRVLTAEVEEDNDLVWLMGSNQGRRFMWRLLTDSGVLGDPFAANAMVLSHQVGRQHVGRRHFAMIQRLCPKQYHVMVEENTDD